MNFTPINQDRFWLKVNKTDSCWEWVAAKVRGYGTYWVPTSSGMKQAYAHRISYALKHGDIPDGVQIDHMCRNRACVDPDHLRPVTNKQNAENLGTVGQGGRSGVRGVAWHAQAGKWWAVVKHDGKQVSGGLHASIAEAERAVVAIRNKIQTHNDADRISGIG